jgi:Cupin domain
VAALVPATGSLTAGRYILSGTVALYDGANWADGTAGDFHYVPERGIHAFRNADPDTPASMLILFAPGAPRERYFDGLAEIIASGRQLSEEEWTKVLYRERPVHGLTAMAVPCRLHDSSTRGGVMIEQRAGSAAQAANGA